MASLSRSAIVIALVVIAAFGTAAVMFVSGDAVLQRLGILSAFLGTIVASLTAALRADQTKTQTNGNLNRMQAQVDAFRQELPIHVQAAVLDALAVKNGTSNKPPQ